MIEKGSFDFDAARKENTGREILIEDVQKTALARYEEQEKLIGAERLREIERVILLRVVDQKWMDHIDAMDQLRYGIGLRAYGQSDPVIEYKFEGFNMFEEMVYAIKEESTKIILNIKEQENKQIKREQVAKPIMAVHGDKAETRKEPVRNKRKVGRNEPCPCGSGKKYKNCCGE